MKKIFLTVSILMISSVCFASGPPAIPPGIEATINDTAGNGDTTVVWSADKSYDMFQLVPLKVDPAFTGDGTITDATPTFILNDSDNAAGTGGFFCNSSGGANDIICSFGVEDSTGASTSYFDLNGVTETIAIKKTMTFLNAGVVAEPAASTDGHTLILARAWGTDTSSNPERKNVATCTNDTAATANNLPECSLDNAEWSIPLFTGDVSTTGSVTGGTKSINIGNTEGVHDGSNDQAVMTDSGESLTVDAYIGMTIYNITDGSSGTITDNDGTTITATLAGGTDNNWDTNDVWAVGPGPRQSNAMFYISASTTIIHPATAEYTAGYFTVGAVTVKVDPASSGMTLNFDASGTYTDPGAGDEVDGPGSNGAFIIFHNRSATEAESFGSRGAWTDGGAS